MECLGVLEAAGEALIHMKVSLTAAMTLMGLGSLVVATPAIMLTQVFPQAKAKAKARMARWDLGMSAGWTTCTTVSWLSHSIHFYPCESL